MRCYHPVRVCISLNACTRTWAGLCTACGGIVNAAVCVGVITERFRCGAASGTPRRGEHPHVSTTPLTAETTSP